MADGSMGMVAAQTATVKFAKPADTIATAFARAGQHASGQAWLLLGDDRGVWRTVSHGKGYTRIATVPAQSADGCGLRAKPGRYVMPCIDWKMWIIARATVTVRDGGDGHTRIEQGRGWLRFNGFVQGQEFRDSWPHWAAGLPSPEGYQEFDRAAVNRALASAGKGQPAPDKAEAAAAKANGGKAAKATPAGDGWAGNMPLLYRALADCGADTIHCRYVNGKPSREHPGVVCGAAVMWIIQ